jgi:hypothetical protein
MNFVLGSYKEAREPDYPASIIGIRVCCAALRGEPVGDLYGEMGATAYEWAHAGIFEPSRNESNWHQVPRIDSLFLYLMKHKCSRWTLIGKIF